METVARVLNLLWIVSLITVFIPTRPISHGICLYLIFPLAILFSGAVTTKETPEDIGDQEEDNRGWNFSRIIHEEKGSEYMKGASHQVDAPPSFIF